MIRFLPILTVGCVENSIVSADPCDLVGGYALCHSEESEEDARYTCSDLNMVLINFFVEDHYVDPDKYKEIYLLGDAEFNGDSWWIDAESVYDCTVMLHGDMYPDRCGGKHPFICEL